MPFNYVELEEKDGRDHHEERRTCRQGGYYLAPGLHIRAPQVQKRADAHFQVRFHDQSLPEAVVKKISEFDSLL